MTDGYFDERVHDDNGRALHDGDPVGGDESDFDEDFSPIDDDADFGFDDPDLASHDLNGDPVFDEDVSLDGAHHNDDDTLDGYSFDDE